MSARKYLTFVVVATLLSSVSHSGRRMGAGESDNALPRYRLHVGQELSYRGESEFKYERGKHITRDTWRVWVVRDNADGSWRLVIRQGSAFSQARDDAKEGGAARVGRDPPENVTFAWCDFYPDGRIVDNDSFGFRMELSRLFPKLPIDRAESEQGWTSRVGRMDESANYRMLPMEAGGHALFEVVREAPMNAIYGVEHKDVVTFNRERGVPETIVSENRQTYGFNGAGTGKTELVEEQIRPPEWCRAFADESERYFAARAAYEKTTRRRDLPPGELKTALDEAATDLKKLGESLETPELMKLLDEQLAAHELSAKYFLEEAEKRLAILGQPSDEWTTTDLDGKTHVLTDYRGKVVILDFWYRGCGWCIRAMPQMKEVAAHFEGQPVVVFGMNTDRDEKDALFVVEKMGLNYANLKATGLPEKYKVRGFPTLIILDQEGVIRDIHVGYSPTLREEVVQSVDRLLKPSP